VAFDFAGALGFGLIIAGIVIRYLGRSRGGDVQKTGEWVSLVVICAGLGLGLISIVAAR